MANTTPTVKSNAESIVARVLVCCLCMGTLRIVHAAETLIVDPLHGPYQTVQAAVDAAAAGDTIFIKAGVYATGGKEDTFSTKMSNRVFIDKSLTLIGEDREKTIIKGAHASTPTDAAGLGLGPDAVRCIGIGASNVVISNLTITGGATHVPSFNDNPDGNGGGVYVPANVTGVQMVDCNLTNNIAQRAAGIRFGSDTEAHFPRCLVVRCWLDSNKAVNRDPVGRACLFAYCLMTRHHTTANLFYNSTLINCTVADGCCRCADDYDPAFKAYNCLFADKWLKGDGVGSYYNCAFAQVDNGFTKGTQTSCQAGEEGKGTGYDYFIAPPLRDYRLHNQATPALGNGLSEYLNVIPAAFQLTDFYGQEVVPQDGRIAIGCSQVPVTPVGGKIRFGGFANDATAVGAYGYTTDPANEYCFGDDGCVLTQMKALGYLYADVWPKSVKLRVNVRDANWPGLFGFSATGADTIWRHAYLDGTYEFCAPKETLSELTLTPQVASTVLYVKQASTVSPEDGSAEAPYTDLQTAIDALPGSQYSVVYVDGGTFRTGGRKVDGLGELLNRVVVPNNKYVHLIGVGGAARNIIVGERDTTDEAVVGMGANAVRALRIGQNSAVQGFTLTGGASHFSESVGYSKRGAGVWLGVNAQALDCIISNNVGRQGAAIIADERGMAAASYAFRCLIADNASLNVGGTVGGSGLVRSTTTASCLFHGNRGQISGSYESIEGHFNTVGDFGTGVNLLSDIATFYDSIAFVPSNSLNNVRVHGGVWNYTAGQVHFNSTKYSTAPALLAAPERGDYRLGTVSPACTSAALASTNVHAFLTRDVFGRPFRFVGAKPVCGAVQDFAPTVVSNGEGTSPSGTNVVTASSITFTATKAATRPFIGFDVNGETQNVAGVTYEYVLPTRSDWQGVTLSVDAIYDTNWFVDGGEKGNDANTGTIDRPKKTLKGGLVNAIAGDVVHVAAGIYATETMVQTNQFGGNPGAYDHAARAVVPTGVALVGAGAGSTYIVGENDPDAVASDMGCGPKAVRCVALAANAKLSGFTLTGGRTDADGSADNFHGGGILGCYKIGSLPQISDCIISNCVGRRGGGAMFGDYSRCRFFDNAVIRGGNGAAMRGDGIGSAVLRNVIVDRCVGGSTLYMVPKIENCTLGADNALVLVQDCPSVCNTLLLGSRSAVGTVGFNYCAWGPETQANLENAAGKAGSSFTFSGIVIAESQEALRVEPMTYQPVVDANAGIDAADASLYTSGNLDCHGNARFVNGNKLDIGAVEADWLDAYSKAIGRRVRVTAADGAVERINGKVAIPSGACLTATVGRGGDDRDYLLAMTVAEASQCAVRKDGVSWQTIPSGTSETRFAALGDMAELAFSASGEGTSVLDGLKSASGVMLIVR